MANVVVVGSQWGDEGKGKIVDWLSEQADIVVRFQGGHNAGHTLVIDGVTYKLSLLPSGVVRPGKLSVIGNGVVLDPHALLEEIERLGAQGVTVTPDSLRIAENATLILPLHQRARCHARARVRNAATRIGTTGRGIGPAYEDKVGRRAIRLMDLADLPALDRKIERLLAHHNALRRGLGARTEIAPRAIYDELAAVAPKVLPYMDSVWSLLDQKRREGKRILFEGAQGALLDIDHGTYPFVTSSNTVAAQAATGSGLGPCGDRLRARHLQGLYNPGRGGAVPDRAGERDRPADRRARARIRHRHRPAAALRLVRRRAGAPDRAHQRDQWVGADQARHPRRLDEIKVCVGYRLDGREIDYLPAGEHAQARVEPIYETVAGLAGADRRRALVGGTAGPGDQICAPDRGAGGVPGRAAVDQPGARGHNPREQSVRDLKQENSGRRRGKLKHRWLTTIRSLPAPLPAWKRTPAMPAVCSTSARARHWSRSCAASTRRSSESDITRERLALEEAIRKVEAEAARKRLRCRAREPTAKVRPPDASRWEEARSWDAPRCRLGSRRSDACDAGHAPTGLRPQSARPPYDDRGDRPPPDEPRWPRRRRGAPAPVPRPPLAARCRAERFSRRRVRDERTR